jgi:feruloyl-CoA synthase
VRVKGPTVTSGYHNDPDKTAAAFDEEGFYKLGDAARFIEPADPGQGLIFDGRVTEDFKLDSGTWVSVGTPPPRPRRRLHAIRPRHGHRRPGQALRRRPGLALPRRPAGAGQRARRGHADRAAEQRSSPERLRAFNAGAGGSSRRIARFHVMLEPPSIDSGEITDKGYVNQRATLERRADLVGRLFANPPGEGVVVV